MIGRKSDDELRPDPNQPPTLAFLLGPLGDALREVGELISEEIERGARNAEIADYLRDRAPPDPRSLEYALWLTVIYWLSPDDQILVIVPPPEDDKELPEETGGGGCLII